MKHVSVNRGISTFKKQLYYPNQSEKGKSLSLSLYRCCNFAPAIKSIDHRYS